MNIISNCAVSVGDETKEMMCLEIGDSPIETNDNTLLNLAVAKDLNIGGCI